MRDNSAAKRSTTGVEDVAASFVKRIALLGSSLAIQSLLAYSLLPEGRGTYAVCIMFAGVLGMLFTPGANIGAQYYVITGRLTLSAGLSAAVIVCLLGGGVGAILGIVLIHSEIAFFDKAGSTTFLIALILVPLSAVSNAAQHQISGMRRFGRLAVFSLCQTGSHAGLVVTLVYGMGLGVDGAILALAAGEIVMISLCLAFLIKEANLHWSWPGWCNIVAVVRYGIRYHPARLTGHMEARIGVIALGVVAGRAEIGFFSVASGLMARVALISDSVVASLVPRLASTEGGRPELGAFCTRITLWTTLVALAGLLSVSVPLVRVLLSAEFLPIVPLMWIGAPGVLILSVGNVIATHFRSTDRPGICSWAAMAGLVVNFSALLILYPRIGISGAAWAMVCGVLVRGIWLSVEYCRRTDTPAPHLFLLQRGDWTRLGILASQGIQSLRTSLRR
jgi:O-antigen/teichoic acid export membrane protein